MGNRPINVTRVDVSDGDSRICYEISLFAGQSAPHIRKTVAHYAPIGCPMVYEVTQVGEMYDVCTGAGRRFVGADPHFGNISAYVNERAIGNFHAAWNEARVLRPVRLNVA